MAPDGSYHQSAANEPSGLNWNLRDEYGEAVSVENHGIGGITCSQMLYGLPPTNRTWDQEMTSTDADVVTFNPGINDAFVPGLQDGDMLFCFRQLVGIARNHGKVVVMMTSNPINNPHNVSLAGWVADELQVALELDVFVVDQFNFIQNDVPDWQAHLPDGIHPDDYLYQRKTQNSLLTLAPILGWFLDR